MCRFNTSRTIQALHLGVFKNPGVFNRGIIMRDITIRFTDSEFDLIEKFITKQYSIKDKTDPDVGKLVGFSLVSLCRLYILGKIYEDKRS